MVWDTSLGYDPDEWEECEEKEPVLIFSFFTRILLSTLAISFCVWFFKLVEQHKNKGKDKDEEEDGPRLSEEQVLQKVSQKLEEVARERKNEYIEAVSADELLREAEEYMRASATRSRDASRGPSQGPRGASQGPRNGDEVVFRTLQAGVQSRGGQFNEYQRFSNDRMDQGAPYGYQEEPHGSLHHQQQPRVVPPRLEKRISQQDEQALRDWEFEVQRLEAERLSKLQDREVGGDESTDFSSSSKALEQLLPGSHISYHSQTPEDVLAELEEQLRPFDTPLAVRHAPPTAAPAPAGQSHPSVGLEGRLITEIDQLAGAVDLTKNRESYRDSELTDYDISDFHHNEPGSDIGPSALQSDLQFVVPDASTRLDGAAALIRDQRHLTGDSDDYVKVNEEEERIYDFPPEKVLTPEEMQQLQDLCQEYDFGIDAPLSPQQHQGRDAFRTFKQPGNENVRQVPIQMAVPPHGGQPQFQQIQHQQPPQFYQQQQAQLNQQQQIQQQQLYQQQQSQLMRQQQQQYQHQPQPAATASFGVIGDRLPPQPQPRRGDPQNEATAELFIQDAIEYIGNNEKTSPAASGFVMEEDMLNSHGDSRGKQGRPQSGDGNTSGMIRTSNVFERVETDDHDDMTYAPDIQSVEIPPDNTSENSENLLEYFDRTAAEGTNLGFTGNLDTGARLQAKPISAQQAALAQAPHIHSASGRRAASNSSLASGRSGRSGRSPSGVSSDDYHRLRKQSSLLSVLGVTSMQEMLLTINSLDALSEAMRKAGLESTNLIFGIDYTASNKYQGEDSFGGRSLHTINPNINNPYQLVITILGRTLAPFASTGRIPVFGFGDAKTGDWSTFPLKTDGDCNTLDQVIKVYNEVTPTIDLSGPTNFAPLIYQAMEICQKTGEYHILVIIADGQVTNERATRRAIVQACQYPLSIIVVGVGDGPWDMMKVFDESLPKRAWDNFHFVEFHEIMRRTTALAEGDLKLAVQSLLEIPDQYRVVCELGLLRNRPIPPRAHDM